MLDAVQNLGAVGLGVPPADAQILAAEHLAQLVADPVDDALEVEPGRHALLDAVDQGQLARSLLQLEREPLGHTGAGQGYGRLAGKQGQHVAVGGGEAAVAAFDVGVEEAEPLAAGRQRRDDATALVEFVGSRGAVSQTRFAGAARFAQPGRDGLKQGSVRLAPRHQGAGDARPLA